VSQLLSVGPTLIWHTSVLYVLAFVIFRMMGKRAISHLAPFDVAVIIMIGEAVAIGIEETSKPIWFAVIPVVILGLLQMGVTWVNLLSRPVERFTQGVDTVLVKDGRVMRKNLSRERITKADILTSLREKGFTNVAGVKEARLEPTGQISVIPMADDAPLTPKVAGLSEDETLSTLIRSEMASLRGEIACLRNAVEGHRLSRA